ncbi:MAG: site-specific integrase, partial [Acholeplasmataceae bacterium]
MEIIKSFLTYLSVEKNYAENTIKSYQRDIHDFNDFLITEELADNILGATRDRLARHYLSYMDQKKYSKKSVARKISALRTFYKYLVNQQLIDVNIFETIDIPKLPKKLPKTLEDDEIDVLFKSIDKKTP